MVWFVSLFIGCSGSSAPDATEPTCDTVELGPQQLRLLTRAEYEATVHDLLPLDGGSADPSERTCSEDADCDLSAESCVTGVCQADPCALVTFLLPGNQGATTVHIAGSFNGWPATVGDGGWPMTWVPTAQAWVAKQTVPDGEHTYKFVVDESTWITDPSNPSTADDGFGGSNSLLQQTCSQAPVDPQQPGTGESLTAQFPAESRPTGYPFDNHGASGLVSAVHVERYARAASSVADRVDAQALLGCAHTDTACVRGWVADFGQRAFRRPLETDELDRYTALITEASSTDEGVEIALRVFLQSPWFLYRTEIGELQGDGSFALTAWERASLLSYTFWGTMPDDALFAAAAGGTLDTSAGIEAEARRLLEDPRARAHLGRFALQWLGVEDADVLVKQQSSYPEWSPALGRSMVESTRRTFEHVFFDGDRSYGTLLTGDTAFVDPPLAALYGVESAGPGFSEVELPPERLGLLGHASVLSTFAHSDQSAPILRGLMVRERLLCEPPLTPPADVPALPEVDPNATTRERLEQHSSDPGCQGCHERIDPVGFALENFDAIGAWRTEEGGSPIDPTGLFIEPDGDVAPDRPLAGPRDLAWALVSSETAHRCFATQVWRFAHGALETREQRCAVDHTSSWFLQSEGDLQEALIAVTQAPDFVRRRAP